MPDLQLKNLPSRTEYFTESPYFRSSHYRSGEIIYARESINNSLFFISSGLVKLSFRNEDGNLLTIDMMQTGEIFGETALTNDMSQSCFVEAVEDTTVFVIHKNDFLHIAETDPELILEIAELISQRLGSIKNKLVAMTFKTIKDRLINVLFDLAEQFGEKDNGKIYIRFNLTHQDLAYMIGTSREYTSIILGELKRKNLISKCGKEIVLNDLSLLKNLIEV